MTETKTVFEKYYEVRHQLDSLAEIEAKLKEEVMVELEKMPESALDKSTYKSSFGNFTKKISKKYAFSTNILELGMSIEKQIKEFAEPLVKQIDEYSKPLKDQVEIAKQKEIETGIAKEQTQTTMAFSYLKK